MTDIRTVNRTFIVNLLSARFTTAEMDLDREQACYFFAASAWALDV